MGTFGDDLFSYRSKMKYQVIVLLICGIRNSAQRNLTEGVCKYSNGLEHCCYNYEAIKGICTECKNGTTSEAGGRCRSCKKNMFGNQCIQKCNCTKFQRCDSAVGCILKTSISTTYSTSTGETRCVCMTRMTQPVVLYRTGKCNSAKCLSTERNSIWNTIPVLFKSEEVTTKQTTVLRIRSSNDEWIKYTLCITGLTLLTCFVHLTRAYIKRRSLKERIVKEKVISEPSTPYMGSCNEVDKNPFTFVTTGSDVTSQSSHNEAINFVCHERQSYTTGNTDDEAGYFDLYFVMKEDVNHKVEYRASHKESLSTSSSNSNVVGQDKTDYHKTYIPLKEYCRDDSHACEVAVSVHQCIEHSSWSDEDTTSNIYSNVCIPLQKNKQMYSQANESHLSSDNKTVHDTTLPAVIPSVLRACYLQDCTYKYAESGKTIDDRGAIASNEDKSISKEKSKTL